VACIAGGMGSILGITLLSRLGVNFTWSFAGNVFDFADYEYIVIPGVLTSVTLMVVVSLLTKPSPEAKWRPFFTDATATERAAV
jgi:solute:Na+ symporter, SSS family